MDSIRDKLDPKSNGYKDVATFIEDVRRIFSNIYRFHQVSYSHKSRLFHFIYLKLNFIFILAELQDNTKTHQKALYMEKFFDEQVKKLLPDYLMQRVSDSLTDGPEYGSKRMRIDESESAEVIDVPDDDVL